MATKKAGSTAKKTTRSKSQSTKTTKVTAVKAASASTKKSSVLSRFKVNDNRTVLAAALIGEFIGAFLLVAAYLVTKGEPLYMGFVLVTLVLVVGTLSGAHLNPLVTVGAWVTRRVTHWRALAYVVAQLLGAGAAYVVLWSFISAYHVDASSAALGQVGPEVYKVAALNDNNHWYVFFSELLGATVFGFVFAGALREKVDRVAKALQVGFGLFVAMLIAGVCASYVSANVVLNPAVAVAAQAVDWNSIDWYAVAAYLVSPLIGGVVGFALRDVVETE